MNKHDEDAEVMPALPLQDIPAAPAVEAGMDVMIAIWVFPKIMVPPNHPFNRVFHYGPSILGYPYFWKHPFGL